MGLGCTLVAHLGFKTSGARFGNSAPFREVLKKIPFSQRVSAKFPFFYAVVENSAVKCPFFGCDCRKSRPLVALPGARAPVSPPRYATGAHTTGFSSINTKVFAVSELVKNKTEFEKNPQGKISRRDASGFVAFSLSCPTNPNSVPLTVFE